MKPTREVVLRKLGTYWPDEVDELLRQLDALRELSPSEEGLARIQLAVIKLSRGNRDELKQNIEAARRDYRDVLAYAEYPKQTKAAHLNHFNLTKAEQIESKAIRKSDREQYLAWLNSPDPE